MLRNLCLTLILACFANLCLAQKTDGYVTDTLGNPLAFATIRFVGSSGGTVANLDGYFSFQKRVSKIEVTYLNFQSKTIQLDTVKHTLRIALLPGQSDQNIVVVKSTSNKVKRILSTVVKNKDEHNPDKFDWYTCRVYYKMIADLVVPDSSSVKDTAADIRELRSFLDRQHIMVTETVSRRTWKKPASLQEDVVATRMSGFKKSIVSGLVTDVLPFHAYGEFINFNGKDYPSPISSGLFQRFQFRLADELIEGNDTLWVINYEPKKDPAQLSGVLFISSQGYAISQLIAHAVDSVLNRDIGIEQQYIKANGRWFPEKLNYTLKWRMNPGSTILLKGVSRIDSVTFTGQQGFRFDKSHTVKLRPGADETADTLWPGLRAMPLAKKEERTYVFMDSAAEASGFNKIVRYAEKLTEGKFPLNRYLDVNVERMMSYNAYEKLRLGWGMQTSEGVSRTFSVGAWGGYGTGDKQWKYGAFAEAQLDSYKETRLRFSFYRDLMDPGRMQIHKDLDKNYIRLWLMNRVDRVDGWSLSFWKKMGYLSAEVSLIKEKLTPQYGYRFMHGSVADSIFNTREVSLKLRYAFGERTTPLFGKYYSSGSIYPVLYGKITVGELNENKSRYTQVLAAIRWEKNFNRFGKQKYELVAGKVFSNRTLPISKLFAGNGFVNDRNALFFFGGMQTMRPYDYYSDQFINFYWLHEFPFRLYRVQLSRKVSIAPSPAIGHNILVGTMNDRQQHAGVSFATPATAYHESGIILNGLLRFTFMNLGYASINMGYFHHWGQNPNDEKSGRRVVGLGFEF